MVTQKVTSRVLKGKSKTEFLLIHGYTGGIEDFNDLPQVLNKTFNATVRIPLLKGHGKKIQHLDDLFYKDFYLQIERELQKSLSQGKQVILGGYSFGALIALELASRYPVAGVFVVNAPYRFKYTYLVPFSLPFLYFRKYWKKHIVEEESLLASGNTYYTSMHRNAVPLVARGYFNVRKRLKQLYVPLLVIHSVKDPLFTLRGAKRLYAKSSSHMKRLSVQHHNVHNVFFSQDTQQVYDDICSFFGSSLKKKKFDKVSVIVPAYNEEQRIRSVLTVLKKAKYVNEIIVVDDGSTDNTALEVKKVSGVKYYKCKQNGGKARAMDIGVKKSKYPVIFFCDADLIDLQPFFVDSIIRPVLEHHVDMFMGLRSNFMQKTVHLFAINTGERALRKTIWEDLPAKYKKGYRIEAGLNHFVKRYGKGYGYEVFNYSNPIQESKHGFVKGTYKRWKMNLQVSVAYGFAFFDLLRKPR